MGHRRIIRAVQVLIVIVTLAGGSTARAGVGLGASFGYTHLSYPDVSSLTNKVIGIPGSQEWGQPGIRIGYLAPSGHWDLNVDVGLVHRSGTISDETTVELLPQVQANVRGGSEFSPFVNAGVGIVHQRASTALNNSVTGTRPVFGAGIGMRKAVSDGHGLVRVELRYDRLSERVKELSPSATFTLPATNLLSIKLGFDLLVVR